MQKTLFYFKFFIWLGIFVFFASSQPARAFEITPVKVLLTVDQSTSRTIVVKIKNTEKNNLNFKLSVLGMTQDVDGRPVFSRGVNLAEGWVYPENGLVNIKSGETKSVNFIVKTPADAISGSYYLGLAVEPVLEKNSQNSLSTRLVSLLTLEVKGLVQESVSIEKWAPVISVTDQKNWKFNLELKNNGTVEVLMKGSATVRNWRGEDIFSQPVVLGNKFLAGSKRVLHPEIVLKNEVNLPGLYSAQIKINYGLTNQAVSSIAYFWYFPMWSKAAAGLVGLILISLVVWIAKRPKKVKI